MKQDKINRIERVLHPCCPTPLGNWAEIMYKIQVKFKMPKKKLFVM